MFTTRREFATYLVGFLNMTATLGFPAFSRAAESLVLPDGSKLDLGQKCPVCGMVVGGNEGQGVTITYRNGRVVGFGGIAAVVRGDGKVVGFDGARCLFVYNSIPQRYGFDVTDIRHQYVMEFSKQKLIEVEDSFFVMGSNVKGRMGYELIPFRTKEEAQEFALKHKGRWIIRLQTVGKKSNGK